MLEPKGRRRSLTDHRRTTAAPSSPVGEALYGVDALASNNIYAVGLGRGPAVLHYDGSRWDHVPAPTPLPLGRLLAVDAVPGGPVWAAGWQTSNGKVRTLAERASSPNSGAVVGSTGVGNATVSWTGPESGSVAADQFGHFDVGGLLRGSYTFTATWPGCQPTSKSVQIRAGTTISISLRVSC